MHLRLLLAIMVDSIDCCSLDAIRVLMPNLVIIGGYNYNNLCVIGHLQQRVLGLFGKRIAHISVTSN
jgi:hypothetical protein